MAHLVSEFGLLVNYKVVALKLNFQPNLNHLDWTSEPKVMPKILTDVQAEILIRIGLGFGVNFFDSLLQVDLNLIGLAFFNFIMVL